jgi:predicted ATPase/class 3 adenylate cyclase
VAHDVAVARDLPAGTVTFLFTDVEGSTKLLHELGAEAYEQALAEHRRVLREAFAGHDGIEVDTQGDAFFVAFPTAPGALQAAAEARQKLAAGPIRVRIGIHTGTPHVGEEGYVGVDVHRAARIAAAGHGGQVLVSAATAALLGSNALRDLGEHRLKDLSAPERIYQLGGEDFPPLKSLHQTNLPVPATPFLGREQELAELIALQEDVRLLTLTGAGGTGKTRLALQAAGALADRYPQGVWWVPLAPLRDPALVLESAGQALGAKDGVAEHIGDKSLLLLFDNFEHLVEAATDLAGLLGSCPNLDLLVTSREPLHVTGEQEYAVSPLAHDEGVEFFLARARAVRPDLEAEAAVSEICGRLDDLPLALELAAARVKALTPAQILERLEHRLPLLTGGARDVPERQRTLRATIEWSYELLTPAEKRLFARLAVFRAGSTLDSAEQIAGADLDTLQSLVDKSLLRHNEGRFWMLETIREFAVERLEESGESANLRTAHARHVRGLVESARPHLRRGREQEAWLRRLDVERDNLRAALGWAFDGGPEDIGIQIAIALGPFWWVRGSAEGLIWLDKVLARPATPELRAHALEAAGGCAWFTGDHARALRLFDEGLAIFRDLGDRAGIAMMMTRLGPPLEAAGRKDEAEAVVRESLAIHRELGDKAEMALALHMLGIFGWEQNPDEARALLEESVELARELHDLWQFEYSVLNLAELELESGDHGRALALCREGVDAARQLGDQMTTLWAARELSIIAGRRGEAELAGQLWGATERLEEELGDTLVSKDRTAYRERVGDLGAAFERGREQGRGLSIDDAVELALASLD